GAASRDTPCPRTRRAASASGLLPSEERQLEPLPEHVDVDEADVAEPRALDVGRCEDVVRLVGTLVILGADGVESYALPPRRDPRRRPEADDRLVVQRFHAGRRARDVLEVEEAAAGDEPPEDLGEERTLAGVGQMMDREARDDHVDGPVEHGRP